MAFSYKPLKKLLVDKEMTITELKTAIGMSSNTAAKLSQGEYVAMEVLDRICNHFGVGIGDVVEHVRDKN